MDGPTLLERAAQHGSPLRRMLSKVWRRYTMRQIGHNDNHRALEQLYALPDPWDLTSAREQSRFAQTNELLGSLVGRVETLLEVGCGEGHQSQYLSRLCDRLYGLDVSARAVARAKGRLPQCHFGVGHLSALPADLQPVGKYDLVVACEVLYYFRDVDAAVRDLSRLGKHCFASFYSPAAVTVAPHVGAVATRRGWIHQDSCTWLWGYWSTAQAPPPGAIEQ